MCSGILLIAGPRHVRLTSVSLPATQHDLAMCAEASPGRDSQAANTRRWAPSTTTHAVQTRARRPCVGRPWQSSVAAAKGMAAVHKLAVRKARRRASTEARSSPETARAGSNGSHRVCRMLTYADARGRRAQRAALGVVGGHGCACVYRRSSQRATAGLSRGTGKESCPRAHTRGFLRPCAADR